MKKWLIVVGAVVVIGVLVILNLRREGSRTDVRAEEVQRRDIVKYITASGRIQAKRKVDVSASAMGKVTRLSVKEGDRVRKGDFLLEIDPTQYQSAVEELDATIRSAEATVAMEKANLEKAKYDLERAKALHEKGAVSNDDLRNAQLNVDITEARKRSAEETLTQYRATLRNASHELNQVRITADISGVITALNVEEGENAIMGTLNVPGTVLLTISDLSEIEAEVEVDETEVVFVKVGQKADVTLDAYPDSSFSGIVTEVGNSAVRTQVGLGQTSVDFKVVVAIKDVIPNVRPGLSASAKIEVAEEKNALSVPIQCLTVRRKSELETPAPGKNNKRGDEEEVEPAEKDIEGVFVIEDGKAQFREVTVGIAGSRYFVVKKGLNEGEQVVSGPFKAIGDLHNGDPVKITKEKAPTGG